MAFNKQENRIGTLFQTPFKRTAVTTESYFKYLVWYIHANAQLHGLIPDFREWKHCSFWPLLSDKPTLLLRDELFQHFGGRDEFIAYHDASNESWRRAAR